MALNARRSAKRVLFCSNNSSGILLFRLDLIKLWLEQGWDVYLLVPFDSEADYQRLQSLGCRCVSVPFGRRSMNPFGLLWLLTRYLYYCWRLQPALVLSYTIKPVLCASIAARLLRIRHSAVITGLGHAFSSSPNLARLLSSIYKVALRRASKVFFLNTSNKQFFCDSGLIRTEQAHLLMGEGVNLSDYPQAPLPNNNPPVFLLIARLLKAKGIREYADASQRLQAQGYQCRCLLLGPEDEGEDAIDAEELYRWQASGYIEYLGCSNDGSYDYLSQADCVVLPSYHEGMSRVLMEAAAVGRPLITTQVPGCQELVDDGVNGWLCPAQDAAALARSMMRFLQQTPSERALMGRRSRVKLEREGFDAVAIAREMYGDLCKKALFAPSVVGKCSFTTE